jgi:transcriptional regulator with XRE-family HTH domain
MRAHNLGEPFGAFRVYSGTTLGAAIRHFRTSASVTQSELARRSGMPRNYVSALEGGLETEQIRRVFDVLRQLGVRVTLERTEL